MSWKTSGTVRQGVRDEDLRALDRSDATTESATRHFQHAKAAVSQLIAVMGEQEFNVNMSGSTMADDGVDQFSIEILGLTPAPAQASKGKTK